MKMEIKKANESEFNYCQLPVAWSFFIHLKKQSVGK